MRKCPRCGREAQATIMSIFCTDMICLECHDAESKHPRYLEARDAELAAIHRGDYNFPGIGWEK